ncbi:MAG: ubiquitin-like small modifier protein 1 [Candidatus Nezhaarchaeales archaeon]
MPNMLIKVKLFASIRERVGTRIVELKVSEGATLYELLGELVKAYPKALKGYLINEAGEVNEELNFLVNGINASSLEGLKTKLKDGDAVSILPPVSGGIR